MSNRVIITIPESEKKKFQSWLNSQGEETHRQLKVMLRSVRDGIVRRAVMFAPRIYGFLAGSIKAGAEREMGVTVEAGGTSSAGGFVLYAPFVEFGTGKKVSIPSDLKDYASQFRGKGIREVNLHARPYFFPAVRLGEQEMYAKLKQMGFE